MANINTITPILKERYGPKIVEQLENYTVFTKRLTKSSDNISSDFGGKYVTFPIHVGRNSGIGSRFEDEALPAAGAQKYDGARVGLKFAYGAIRVSGPSIALSDENPKAFAKVITEETEGVTRDLARDFNRQLFGNGNGAMAYFSAGSTGTTATVAKARGLGQGDLVDVYDNTGAKTSGANGVTILAVNPVTRVITFSVATVVVSGGYLTRKGSGNDPVKGNREITGLDAIVDDSGILYNVDPSIQPVWKAVEQTASGVGNIEEDLTLLTDQIFANGGKTNLLITTQGVRRAYAKELMTLRQTVNRTEHEGGFSSLKFTTDGPSGEIDILVDLDAPTGSVIALDMSDLTLYRDKAWDWLERDGSMWKQEVTANGPLDAWRAEIAEYHELAISRRNTHGKLTGITEA